MELAFFWIEYQGPQPVLARAQAGREGERGRVRREHVERPALDERRHREGGEQVAQPGGHPLGPPAGARTARRPGEVEQVLVFDFVEAQDARKRDEHLRGRVLVAPAFQSQVVVGADAGQRGDFLAPQSGDAAAGPGWNSGLLRRD